MRPFVFLAAFAGAPLFGAVTSPPADIVALPEFKVFADRPLPKPEEWFYVRSGNFEVLSNASERTTKRFVKDVHELQIVMGVVSPMARIKSELPLMIVLGGKGNVFETFAVKPTVRSTKGLATSLLHDDEIASIVVDFQASSISESVLSGASDWVSERDILPNEEFFRAYVHLMLSQSTPRPPAWFAEGIANIYSSIEYNNKWIVVGLPKSFRNEITVRLLGPRFGDPFFGGSFSGHASLEGKSITSNPADYSELELEREMVERGSGSEYIYQRPLALQSFEKLFSVNYDSPQFTGRSDRKDHALAGWQKQATAFVHMGLYGEGGRYRVPLLKFVARATRGPVTEEFFKECFGMNYQQMETQLRNYTDFTHYAKQVYTAKKGTGFLSPAAPIVVRPATDAEIGRIKGETLRLAGQDEAARREFVVAYLRGERDPQLLASLGLMARQRKDDARAKTYLEAMAASPAPVPRPRAYLELARLRSAENQTKADTPMKVSQVARVLKPLFVTQQLQPQLADVYLEIANTWEHSATPPTRENLEVLEHGVRLFPGNGELLYRTAALLIKHGYKADATPLIQRALDVTRDPELRRKIEDLRQQAGAAPAMRTSDKTRLNPESSLTPEQRQSLANYRAAKASTASELRAKIASVAGLDPAARENELTAFASAQAPRLRALERDTERLEAELGRPPDENDDYVFLLASPDSRSGPAATADLGRLRTALLRPQGLSPPQRGLVQEMILTALDGAAPSGAFLFFSPDTARVRFPADVPPELAEQIAAYGREKDALKQELHVLLRQHEGLDSDFVRSTGLSALAQQQAPRFAALENRADAIRRGLAQLPSRPVASDTPELPAALAARLTAYQNNRTELQKNARRELRALRNQLPAGGAEIVATGEGPRLELKVSGNSTAPLQTLRTAIDTFNRDYAGRFAALNRDLAELRSAIAAHARHNTGETTGKSIDDLMQDFIGAALRQTSTEAYQDCRTAVFLPGLSPEQRRLLFGRLGEKHPTFILEF